MVREKRSSDSPRSPGRKGLFTLAALLIPIAFFALLEGGLRLAGYGQAYPLFKVIPGYEAFLYPNEEVARRYFPAANTIPGIPFDSFPADKDSAAYRIFLQGGSSAAGYPYYYGAGIADMLEQRLLQTFPGRPIEVVNTAMSAVNSFTLYDFVDEILEQDPDLVIIYAGHNEYYGALGVGSSITLGPAPSITRLYLKLDGLRTVQGLRSVLSKLAALGRRGNAGAEPSGTLMEQVVGDQSIAFGSANYHRGVDQFRSNLGRILDRYRRANVPVLIGTLASNLRDQQPFVNELLPQTDREWWTGLVTEARRFAAEGDTASALGVLDRAISIDSTGAATFWLRARLQDRAGHFEDALTDYIAAKDRDQLRFRAPEAMNAVIRGEAARTGAIVVETQKRLADTARDGIIGRDLMTEHLHPNIEGYFQLASAFYEAMRAGRLIADWSGYVPDESARAEVLMTEVDSLVATYRVRQLTGSWPFRPHGEIVHFAPDEAAGSRIEALAARLYTKKVTRQDALDELRSIYLEADDYHNALRATLAVIQRYPFAPQAYLAAASIMVEQRRLEEALQYVGASLDRGESTLAHELRGSVLLALGRTTDAVPALERAVELDPQNVNAMYNLAGAHALSGSRDEARQMIERLRAIRPDHEGARQLGRSLGMDI